MYNVRHDANMQSMEINKIVREIKKKKKKWKERAMLGKAVKDTKRSTWVRQEILI